LRVDKNIRNMKTGDFAKADPILTNLDGWVEGRVINIKNNPFKGIVVAIQDNSNRIFFGEEKYFKQIDREPCLQ
jgi:hypothetical protein